jgi:hypothetical protein
MQYMCLIYTDPAVWQTMSEDDRASMLADYGTFTESIRESGHFLAGDALQPTDTATTVRVRGGETLTTDGPFAETKEQLGGVFITDLPDLDEAIRIAALVPAAQYGTLEIRPLISR